MRFDPQAGFTPTEEGAAPAPFVRDAAPPGRAPRVFLAWIILGGLALGLWQFGLPIFAPSVLNALSPASTDAEADEEQAGVSARLSEALQMVARSGGNLRGQGRGDQWTSGAAFEAPVDVDESAMLALVDQQIAAEEREAWREEAEQAQVAMEMAEQLMSRGKYVDAERLLRRVLEHSPNHAQAHYKLGLACVMQGKMEGAGAELKELRSLDPSLASLLSNLVPKSR